MPALPPYIPAKDADFTGFMQNLATLITANPYTYGVTPADAANISAQNAAWVSVWNPLLSPSTKTAQAVAAKNVARVTVTAQVRTYCQAISNNPGVSVDSKIALRLNPKTSTPSPITPPTTNPVLSLQGQAPLLATFYMRDSSASTSVKAKPYGVTSCQVYGMASATPVTDRSTLPLIAQPTKSPFQLHFTDADVGKQFYLAARWIIRTGELGPWSSISSLTVTG
jgi:hypothetical protein